MATTYTENGGGAPNGSKLEFTYTFPILQTEDIEVQLNGTPQATTKYTVDTSSNPTKITFNNTNIDSTVQESTGAPKTGVLVTVARVTTVGKTTGDDDPKAVFASGSSIRAVDLNANTEQALYAIHELQERKVTTTKILDNSVTTDKILDGTIVNADISATADIANTKIADGLLKAGLTVNSDNIVNGSIVDADINASADIAGSKLLDDSVTLDKLGSGALPTDITVASANIVNGTIVDGDIATGTLDNRYYTETELNNGQLNNLYYTETELNNGQLDTRYYSETELDAGQLDNRYFTETELSNGSLDGRYFTETELTNGSLDGRYYTETELNPSAGAGNNVLDARYFTETELTNGALDSRYYTETEAEAKFLRQDSTETIASGVTWSSTDDKVATTAAIDLRVIELVDDVGGFVPIANETSFPTTNPDINTSGSAKSGTIVSVLAASTNLTAQSGTTLTIANGRGTGNAVIITGVSATIPQGFGFLVETTATDHTYSFHRLVPKATEVSTVAANAVNIAAAGANVTSIDNFADRYQINTNAPTARPDSTNLVVGDLWFDSSSNKVMMVYDASSGDGFSPITPNQSDLTNINIVAGQITFQEDLGLITNAINTGSGNNSVNTVGSNIASVNTAATNIAKINTVADDLNETTSEIDTVATNIANVNNVGNNISNVNAVHNNATNINAAVANATNINAAVSNATNINTVAGNNSNITTVAGANSNITTVAGANSNISTVASAIANVNTTASNISSVNNFANVYRIDSSDPQNNNDEGDLYFNTTSNELRVYNGSSWQGGVTATGNLAGLGSNTFTGTQTLQAGLAVTGNITVSGTVDGVDVAAFKTSFDNLNTDLVTDTTPQLGGALDAQNNNMSNVGTIDGANLQLDFGTI